MMKRTKAKEREIKEIKDWLINENAYNLNIKEKEGMKPNINNKYIKIIIILELMGNRKSNINDNDEIDKELNWWIVDKIQPIDKIIYKDNKCKDQQLNQI